MMLDSIRTVGELLTSRIRRTPVEPADVLGDLLDASPGGEVVQAVFWLIPRIFDVPLNLKNIQQLREATVLLCRSAVATLELNGEWLPLVDDFFVLLACRVRRSQSVQLKKYPFLFHVPTWRQAVKAGRQGVYETLALRAHVALRTLEEEMHHSPRPFGAARRKDNLYRYSLTIRRLIEYVCVMDLPHSQSLHVPLPVPVINDAYLLAGTALGRPTRASWNQTLEDCYGRCLALFCRPRRMHPRYRRNHPRPRIQPLHVGPRAYSFVEEVDGQETVITVRAAPNALEEAECLWDYSTAVDVPGKEDSTICWTPSWGRPRAAMLSTPWDTGVAQPPELLVLHRSLWKDSSDRLPRNDLVLGLAALTIIHCGVEPADAVGLVPARPEDPIGPQWWITPQTLTISHSLPDDLPAHKDYHPDDPAAYQPYGGLVELPLLPPLSGLVYEYDVRCRDDASLAHYLQLDTPQGLQPLTLADLEGWLYRISPTLTPIRLRRTFEVLYTWAGLEPILCALIANRLPARLRATVFYTNISLQQLARRYAAAHRRVLALIGVHY